MKRVCIAILATLILAFAQVPISGDITSNSIWTADQDYRLVGQTFVKAGVTLTIEPGTVIKADPDDGTGIAPALVIERGAKIIANGTADAPITFTSSLPESELPQRGTWGGLIILGNAPTNKGESFIEGLVGVPYGGHDPDDDSGILRYVRVWYGGAVIGQDNEINGISFGAVGRGTTVEHCEVAYNLDDGFEFFGGTVEVKYLSALFCGDDAFDTDEGYQGKGQFLFTMLGQDICGRGFEMDNDGSDFNNQPRSYPQFSNVTMIGPNGGTPDNDGSDEMIRLREGTGGDFRNILIVHGNGVGLAVKEADTQALIGDSILWNAGNIIFDCDLGQFAPAQTGVLSAVDADPLLRAMEAGLPFGTGQIDPRLLRGSPALNSGVELPDDGFFTQVSYVGAFGEELWLEGWSILADKGRLANLSAVENEASFRPETFELSAYPNPFNPQAQIRFSLPTSRKVNLSVYNLAGKELMRLVDGELDSGYHSVSLDGSGLATGIYFIRLESAGQSSLYKITLLK